MATPTFPKIIKFSRNKNESRRSNGSACEKYGSTHRRLGHLELSMMCRIINNSFEHPLKN